MEFEIVCVDRGQFPGGGSKIIRYGIHNGAGVEVISKEELFYRMSNGDVFYMLGGGKKAYVTKGKSEQGHTFAETVGDNTLLNNLEFLPGCTHDDKITYGTGVSDPNDVDAGSDGGPEPEGPDTDVDEGNPDDN